MSFLDGLLEEAAAFYATHETLDRDTLLRLSDAFGSELLSSALEIVDTSPSSSSAEVTRVVAATSKRSITSVKSTSGLIYVLFPAANRCSCMSWVFR